MTKVLNLIKWFDGENNIQSVDSFKSSEELSSFLDNTYPSITGNDLEHLKRYNAVFDEQSNTWLQVVSSSL